MIFVWDCTRGR